MTPVTAAATFAPESLEGLLTAQAVTIVGASKNSSSVGFLLANLLDGPAPPFDGKINLVNRSRPVLHGIQAVASTDEVEGPPGLVMLFIPPQDCVAALEALPSLPQGAGA
jgi:acyl-CoA synthetase (NDP forming)